MVGDLFDHLILIKEIRLQEFIETYYHHVKMTDNINEFLATKFYMDKCPILDIGIEELKKFSLEKVYRTILRVVFLASVNK